MSTITEKLNTVETSVSDIKQAIVNKGGTIFGNITTYASAITNLPSGGSSLKNTLYDSTNNLEIILNSTEGSVQPTDEEIEADSITKLQTILGE